jgi:hypothetical protein
LLTNTTTTNNAHASKAITSRARTSLNGTWQFFPDVAGEATLIRYDSGDANFSAIIGLQQETGIPRYARMRLDIPVSAAGQIRYAKLLAHLHVGDRLAQAEGADGYYVLVKVNTGQWHAVDLAPYMNNGDHWVELPVVNEDLVCGTNEIMFSSTVASSGRRSPRSLDLLGSGPAANGARACTSQDGVAWEPVADGNWRVRLQYSTQAYASWQPIEVPGVWEGHFTYEHVNNKFVQAKINGHEWLTCSLNAVAGEERCWLEFTVPASYLKAGANTAVLDSTIANTGNLAPGSLDLLASAHPSGRHSYVSHDLETWDLLPDRNWHMRLLVQSASTMQWQEYKHDDGNCDLSTVIGLYTPNQKKYYERTDFELGEAALADIAAAKLVIEVHLGSELASSYTDSLRFDGVGWYRTALPSAALAEGAIQWLHCDAADYRTEAWLNGYFIGSHEGGYTPFRFQLPPSVVNAGGANELVMRVTDQYDPRTGDGHGHIPIKETPAGFLQDSIGLNYGGLWQDVCVEATAPLYMEHLFMNPDIGNDRAEAIVTLCNKQASPAAVAIEAEVTVRGEKQAVGTSRCELLLLPGERRTVTLLVPLEEPRLWSPAQPFLYTATVTLMSNGHAVDWQSTDFGMREVRVSGYQVLVNGVPVQLTGMLHWGLYWETIAEKPTVQQVRTEIADLKAAGFNAIKFCLFDPPDYVLDELDRLGMYAYVEYPIWNPVPTPAFFTRVRRHIPEMLIKDRNHPSVIMTDFNCEMHTYTPGIDALMAEMYQLGKKIAPNRLYLDNSTTGVTLYGDFYATHPYNQLNKFDAVIREWVRMRGEQGVKPLILGEYADTDTIRDTEAIKASHGGQLPWWWSLFQTNDPNAILEQQGFSSAQIRRFRESSRANALMAKKHYIEASRLSPNVAALFITHIRDIPQTQAGFYDDNMQLKYAPLQWRESTAETVLLLDRHTHNVWNGSHFTGTPHLSHYNGLDLEHATLEWQLLCKGGGQMQAASAETGAGAVEAIRADAAAGSAQVTVASGICPCEFPLPNGNVYALPALSIALPERGEPVQYTLRLSLRASTAGGRNSSDTPGMTDHIFTNEWPVWGYPNEPLPNASAYELPGQAKLAVQAHDPGDELQLHNRYPWITAWNSDAGEQLGQHPDLIVATAWAPGLDAYLAEGGSVLYAGHEGGPIAATNATFNVWSFVAIPEPAHPALANFPHEGYAGQQFWELAATHALDYCSYFVQRNAAPQTPAVLRIEPRSYHASSCLSEFPVGDRGGSLLQTTLRLGSTASSNEPHIVNYFALFHDAYENVAGLYLLDQLIRYKLGKLCDGSKGGDEGKLESEGNGISNGSGEK